MERHYQWSAVLEDAAHRFGTPTYVTCWQPVLTRVEQLESLIHSNVRVRSWLSFKTHPMPPLVSRWLRTGRGVEVVSEAEFVTAKSLGALPHDVLVNGVAKHSWLHRYPARGLRVHFDSAAEVASLIPMAVSSGWRVGVRCHVPDEGDARDDRHRGQFGMTGDEAVDALRALTNAGADVQGIHFHIGQRPRHPEAYERAVEHVAKVCALARFAPRYIDLGGGLPTGKASDAALRALTRAMATAIRLFSPSLQELWLENGRFITESSTALAVRILDVKTRGDSRYLICDGGRTNQALAADHGVHPLISMPVRQGDLIETTVCGPTCMTDDVLGHLMLPADLSVGDVLGWLDAGAYHLPWETRFSQGLCAVAWVDDQGALTLAREREGPESWGRLWARVA